MLFSNTLFFLCSLHIGEWIQISIILGFKRINIQIALQLSPFYVFLSVAILWLTVFCYRITFSFVRLCDGVANKIARLYIIPHICLWQSIQMWDWGLQFSIIYNMLTSGLITKSAIFQDIRYPLLHSNPRTEGIQDWLSPIYPSLF